MSVDLFARAPRMHGVDRPRAGLKHSLPYVGFNHLTHVTLPGDREIEQERERESERDRETERQRDSETER